jgi:hypothetical protein
MSKLILGILRLELNEYVVDYVGSQKSYSRFWANSITLIQLLKEVLKLLQLPLPL